MASTCGATRHPRLAAAARPTAPRQTPLATFLRSHRLNRWMGANSQLPTPNSQPFPTPNSQFPIGGYWELEIGNWEWLGLCPPPLVRHHVTSSGEVSLKRASSLRAKAEKLVVG